jgi:hypothetical protein
VVGVTHREELRENFREFTGNFIKEGEDELRAAQSIHNSYFEEADIAEQWGWVNVFLPENWHLV